MSGEEPSEGLGEEPSEGPGDEPTEEPRVAPRVALVLSYSGESFHGWQYQGETTPTVQLKLSKALEVVATAPVTIFCAGRTDTGVHATKQVVHFDSEVERPSKSWLMGANAHLPDSVSVTWAGSVTADFDARRSATARRYVYVIYNSRVRSALFPQHVTREHRQLDAARMHEAAQALPGEQDFSAFRAANCQSLTPMRNVHKVSVTRRGDLIVVDITANAFLHHMVRNIAGTLMDVGAGLYEPAWVKELLAKKDRTLASKTAPPNGLYLVDVHYPETFGIPAGPVMPHLLGGLVGSE